MDNLLQILGVIFCAYILGSLNFALVFSKLVLKFDIREHGSKNAGTTNVLRIMGKKWAISVLLLDMLKAVCAVFVGNAFLGDEGKLLAGIFVILGHVFPVFFKFKGGKGVATTAGMFLAFDLKIFAILAVIFFIMIFITKIVSISSMTASAVLPIVMYIYYDSWIFPCVGFTLFMGIVYVHRPNIARMIAGEENKISFKKK